MNKAQHKTKIEKERKRANGMQRPLLNKIRKLIKNQVKRCPAKIFSLSYLNFNID